MRTKKGKRPTRRRFRETERDKILATAKEKGVQVAAGLHGCGVRTT